MASQYSTRLKLELIGSGEQSNSWGVTTNNTLSRSLEEAITGVLAINLGSASSPLTLTSGGSGGNTNQLDPSNNPFQIASNGTLQLKAGQFLNSDIFNQYKYNATYQDNFNAASSSGVITVNITDDPIPTLTNNANDEQNGQPLFYVIESITNGADIIINTNGVRFNNVAKFFIIFYFSRKTYHWNI